ncbi:MAG: hypothetical protein LKK00_01765 [Intestinimonas sp.]|jgi:hypothetical protein|nr:hypothetical protein [Intestinimonas sp.]
MKRVGLLLSAFLIISTLAACSSGGSGSNVSTAPDTPTPSTSSQETGSSPVVASSADPVATEKTKFEQFEAGLDELGITYEKVAVDADMVGAQQGTKYKLSDGNVELYKFDTSTDAYNTASKNKAITLQGFGDFPAEFNNDMALVFDDEVSSKADIQNLFSTLS